MPITSINIDDLKNNNQLLKIGNSSSVLFSGAGSIIKGTVSGVGDKASIDIGDKTFKVSSDIVKNKQIGDEVNLQVESQDGASVKLKVMQNFVGANATGEKQSQGDALNSFSQMKVEKDTESFVNILSESDLKVDIEGEVSEEADAVSRLDSKDVAYLRRLGIDVSNADFSTIMGLVNQKNAVENGTQFVTGSPEVTEAISKAQNVGQISDGAMRYMMDNGMDLTYDNVYTAEHSSLTSGSTMNSAYYSGNAGAGEISDAEWTELAPQAEKMLNSQGVEVNDANMSATKWLISQGVDVTASNIDLYNNVQDLNKNGVDADEYAKNLVDSLNHGDNAGSARLMGESYSDEAARVVQELSTVTDEAVTEADNRGLVINIRNLYAVQKDIDAYKASLAGEDNSGNAGANRVAGNSNSNINSDNQNGLSNLSGDYSTSNIRKSSNDDNSFGENSSNQNGGQNNGQGAGASQGVGNSQGSTVAQGSGADNTMTTTQSAGNSNVSALNQLRLKLTLDSGYTLLRSGLDIYNTSIKDVLSEVQAFDESELDGVFRDSRVDMTSENVSIYTETMAVKNVIPSLPAATLGNVDADSASLRDIYTTGIRLAKEYEVNSEKVDSKDNVDLRNRREAFNNTYEALMTAPRADMGDKITDAFRNVDSLLETNGIEVNAQTEKAARILGYNGMEITSENIEKIVTLDDNLTSALNRMQPETVLGMIRDNVNPLNMNMEELNNAIDAQEEKLGITKEQKFSEFLVKLDNNNDITAEERESYIGIYRAINRVSSFSGRDLGAVVNSDEEITLRNLIKEHNSRRHSGNEYVIDDNFGTLESLNRQGKSIIDQIMTAYDENRAAGSEIDNDAITEADTELLNSLSDYSEETKREAATLLKDNGLTFTPANLSAAADIVSETGEFYQQIKDTLSSRNSKVDNTIFEELENKIYESFDDAAALADRLNSNSSSVDFRSTNSSSDVSSDDIESNINTMLNENSEIVSSATTVSEASDVSATTPLDDAWFITSFADTFHAEDDTRTFTAKDLSAGRKLNSMMHVADSMRRSEDYLIPITVDDQVMTLRLKVDQGNEDNAQKGFKLSIDASALASSSLSAPGTSSFLSGNVTAEFDANDTKTLKLTTSESVDTEAVKSKISNMMSSNQISLNNVNSLEINGETLYTADTSSINTNDITTRDLYNLSKVTISIIKSL